MSGKMYQVPENKPSVASEPAVAYSRDAARHISTSLNDHVSTSEKWNPNVPFHGTQEEWWEHFHCIEEGEFETWEEHQRKFYAWKKDFLANHI
jgi:hypothetical protein